MGRQTGPARSGPAESDAGQQRPVVAQGTHSRQASPVPGASDARSETVEEISKARDSGGSAGATRRTVLAAAAPALGGCLGATAPAADRDPESFGAVDARLGFVGDVMLGRRVDEQWSGRDPSGIWGPLGDRLRGLDGLFLNLECCLSTRGERWPDKTYYFRADPEWAVPALDAAGTTWASLANNHILDFGQVGLEDTRESLSSAGIGHAGSGPDRETATAPSIVEAGPLDVAVVALTDRWSEYRATEESPGTAYVPLDPSQPETRATVRRSLQQAKTAEPDLLVASLHWGPNWEPYPEETHREFGRWLVEQGVDLVHGHSAHVVQGVERYQGKPILYDTGDFVDDYSTKPDLRNDRSFLFVLEIADGRLDAVRLQPVEIEDEAVRPAGHEAVSWLHEELETRCEPFDTPLITDDDDLVVPFDE